MFEEDGCLVAIVIAVVVLIAGVIVPTWSYYSDRAECSYAGRNSGAATKFVKNHIYSWDCYVSVDGRWIPIDKWRGDSED